MKKVITNRSLKKSLYKYIYKLKNFRGIFLQIRDFYKNF